MSGENKNRSENYYVGQCHFTDKNNTWSMFCKDKVTEKILRYTNNWCINITKENGQSIQGSVQCCE